MLSRKDAICMPGNYNKITDTPSELFILPAFPQQWLRESTTNDLSMLPVLLKHYCGVPKYIQK
jgi:hypothetical protein